MAAPPTWILKSTLRGSTSDRRSNSQPQTVSAAAGRPGVRLSSEDGDPDPFTAGYARVLCGTGCHRTAVVSQSHSETGNPRRAGGVIPVVASVLGSDE